MFAAVAFGTLALAAVSDQSRRRELFGGDGAGRSFTKHGRMSAAVVIGKAGAYGSARSPAERAMRVLRAADELGFDPHLLLDAPGLERTKEQSVQVRDKLQKYVRQADEIARIYPGSRDISVLVVVTALQLRTHPYWLANLINFESGGTWSSSAINGQCEKLARRRGRDPLDVCAVGLIQFLPPTAVDLGTTTSKLSAMTPREQMAYVYRYLEPYGGRLTSVYRLYMSVFYPLAMRWPADRAFPVDAQAANIGVFTPGDYLRYASGYSKLPSPSRVDVT